MKRAFALLATAMLSLGGPSLADDTFDEVAQFEIQSPEPSTSGYIFTRMGVVETLVDAEPDGRLVPALATKWSTLEDGLT